MAGGSLFPTNVVPLRPEPEEPLAARDDEALMLLASAGATEAFEVLTRRHLAGIARFCAKLTGDTRLGEEVAQETLLEAWSSRARYRSGRLSVWLLTIARHRCLNVLRSERLRERHTARTPAPEAAPPDAASPAPGQLDALLDRERGARVLAAIGGLPEKLREALLLRYDQELGYPEISQIVGRGEATVRSRVFHALRLLRASLGEEAGG